ncbi:ATP-binding protein [Albimonas sp. CAU 1670]|uniref:two-component system sensor histidine kinase NtrB n=1 Tax=Albimonas sp. CAU 1670 TaxID=3032599 RepID=UPI0023DBAF46|nr:ATP-binding protein [Albimonas sp. CAU 1670]MDF2233093.1 ATP-binding protein [Albimonas sp. CAU 1670]
MPEIPATSCPAIWNAVPFAALVLDPEDRVQDANSAAEVFFGMSSRSLAGRSLETMFGPASRVADLVGQVRHGSVSLAEHQMELSATDRAPRIVDLYVSLVSDDAGQVLVMIQPQSIAEKMDRTLSHRAAARSVSGMAAMLAHEIKNPLAGISGAAQLLAMQLGDEETELTDLIREEAERIASLLNKVELFGDSRPAPRDPVNIHDVLDRAKRSAAAGFARHVRFVEEYDPSLPPTAGDADLLMQVFQNLLKNAAEATPEVGGMITIRTSYRPGIRMAVAGGGTESLPLQVSISDNGSGVPEQLKRDIFEPFVTSKATGSGLGLAMVSKLVADHGGVIECESDPGWTTFRVLLPVWSDPEVKKKKPAPRRRKEKTA